jgi:uncharacterized protein (UPF0335 family)
VLTAMITGNDIGIWFGIGVAAVSSIVVIRARSATANDEEAVRTATLMTAQVTALDSKVQLLESEKRNLQTEISHLHELRTEDAKTAGRNAEDIKRLTELVTQQAAVEQFRTESLTWFEAIAAAVNAEPPQFPDHVQA